MNRAIVVARVRGPEAGLQALGAMTRRRALENYHLFHAVLGQLLLDAGRPAEAESAWRRALTLATLPAERRFLQGRLEACTRPP